MRIVRTLCSALVVLLGAGGAGGATFTVTRSSDFPDANIGDGQCVSTDQSGCTLRAAVQEANASVATADTVVLQNAGPFELTIQELNASDPDEDAAGTGDLDVTGVLTIETSDGTPREITVDLNEQQGDPPEDRIFHVLSGGDLTLNDLILTDGVATSASTSTGGAIHNAGILSLSGCSVEGNAALEGGGIYNDGDLSVDGSTFTGNSASAIGAALFGVPNSTQDLENSTLSGNVGPETIRLLDVASSTLLHVTVASNQGIGIVASAQAFVTITSSIVANQSGSECSFSGAPTRLDSLASDGSCGFGGANGGFDNTDPLLDPLADNGGPTLTHLPDAGSLAIDNASGADCLTEDQRSVERPDGAAASGGDCDIGAVELLPEPGSTVLLLAALIGSAGLARRRA